MLPTSIKNQVDCWTGTLNYVSTNTTDFASTVNSTYSTDTTIQPIALPCLTQQA